MGLLNSHNWQNKQLTQSEQDQTSTGIFGATGGSGGGGIFGPTLDNVKASQLFTTISVGVSAEVIVFVGGLGGLGCAWDIAKREGPKGYGYATAELGFKIAADVNVQACIFNKMPHELNMDIFGLTVSVYVYGLGATFAVFFTGKDMVVLGYSIAIGAGWAAARLSSAATSGALADQASQLGWPVTSKGKPMAGDFDAIINQTLSSHAELARTVGARAKVGAFQWPWDIASAGARHLQSHGSAVSALVDGGSKAVSSPSGSSIISSVSSGPTNPANTDKLLNDGIFSKALDSVKADQLLRTVFIGWSTGVQVGLFGGGGGSGVAYDIIDNANRAAVNFSSFNLGVGGSFSVGLLVGAMTAQPRDLNYSTNAWQFGASLAVSVGVMVIMNNADLSLVGFALNLGGGGGLSSSVGYGSISASG